MEICMEAERSRKRPSLAKGEAAGPTKEEVSAFEATLHRLERTHPSVRLELGWVDQIITAIEGIEPELGTLLRRGDDPQHDVAMGPVPAPEGQTN
jgi:hypothetical protein